MAFSQIRSPYKTDQNHLFAGHMNRVLAMCFWCVYSLVRFRSPYAGWNAIGAATMKRKKERTSTKAEWSLQSYHISCRCPPPGPAERHSNHRTLRKGGRKGLSAMSECQFLEVSCRSPVGFCILPRCLVLSGVVAILSQL